MIFKVLLDTKISVLRWAIIWAPEKEMLRAIWASSSKSKRIRSQWKKCENTFYQVATEMAFINYKSDESVTLVPWFPSQNTHSVVTFLLAVGTCQSCQYSNKHAISKKYAKYFYKATKKFGREWLDMPVSKGTFLFTTKRLFFNY